MRQLRKLLVVVLVWLPLPAAEGQSTGDVRLVNGGATFQGRVELFFGDKWGTVCSDIWQLQNSHVVCQQLGYTRAVGFRSFGGGSGPIILDDVSCLGNESNLLLCNHNPVLHTNCNHDEDVGVICAHKVGDLQLTGHPNNPYEGRVEIFSGQAWATVCDDGWDKIDADVVCRQLGYPRAVRAVSSQKFNTKVEANMPILYSEVQCLGTEKKIDDCVNTVVNASSSVSCSHVEDAGVVCQQLEEVTMATSTQGNSSVSELPIVVGVVVAVVIISLVLLVVCVAVVVSVCRGRKENGSNEGGSSGSAAELARKEENGIRQSGQPNTLAAQGDNTAQNANEVDALSETKKHAEDTQDPDREDMKEDRIEKQWALTDV